MRLSLITLCIMGMLFVSAAQAIHFTPYHQMTYSNSDATVKTIAEPNGVNDRHDYWDPNDNSTVSGTYIEIAPGEYVQADSDSSIQFDIDTEGAVYTNNRIHLTADAHAAVEMTTEDGIDAYAWAGSSAVSPGYATGNFYTIEADGSEVVGTPVLVTFRYLIQISTSLLGGSSNSAIVNGGWAGDDVLVTINCADLDDPQPSEIAYVLAKKDTDGTYSDEYAFEAKIGDVIGLHFGTIATAYTGMSPGSATGNVSADLQIAVTGLVFKSQMADFDDSNKVDMIDLIQFAGDWLSEEPEITDLNFSGKVDMVDFGLFSSAWLWELPPNDTCETAWPIQLDTHYIGTTSGMINNYAWYVFTPGESDFYTLSICDGGEDYYMELYDACEGNSLGTTGYDCQLAVWMYEGVDYRIAIYGYEPSEDYNLIVTQGAETPYNDECSNAGGIEDYVEGTTVGAAGDDQSSCGENDTHDVWYIFTPQDSGYYTAALFTVGNMPFAGTLTVYNGDSCEPPANELICGELEGDYTELSNIWMDAEYSYLLRVGSASPDAGRFGVEILYNGPGE